MIDEIKKLFCESRLLFLLILCLLLNGVLLLECLKNEESIKDNTQRDYELVLNNIKENYEAGVDRGLMMEMFNIISSRDGDMVELAVYKDYAEWKLDGIMLIVLMAMIAVELFSIEARTNMRGIVIASEKSIKSVFRAKIGVIFLVCISLSALLLAEEFVIICVTNNISPDIRLYQIPFYFQTWFSGSIFEYRSLIIIGYGSIAFISAAFIYVLSELRNRKTIIIACISSLLLVLYWAAEKLPYMANILNIWNLCDTTGSIKRFEIMFISSERYIYLYELGWVTYGVLFAILLLSIVIYVRRK